MNTAPKPAAETPPAPGFLGALTGAFGSARQVLVNFVDLIAQETRRAGLTLMAMVALGVLAAILFVTAWLCFMAALTLWLVAFGVTWFGAIAWVGLANLLVAGIAVTTCIVVSRNLLFPATRRQLKARSSASSSGAA